MRVLTLVLILAVALPLSAQTPAEPRRPFDETVYVGAQYIGAQYVVAQTGPRVVEYPINLPQIPPQPNGNAQVQQAIEKLMPVGREVLTMDLDSVLLSSAAKSLAETVDVEIRKLLGGLKSIQIRGFEMAGSTPEVYRSKIQPIRDVLKDPLWVRYAAHTSAQSEMEIWSGRQGNSPTGVLLLSITGKQVFIMHVVGNIRPDQLMFLSGMLGIPNFSLPLGQR